jgi:hypothetical protein
VTNLVIDKNIELRGEGRMSTIINCTTTTTHGMAIRGDSTVGSGNCIRLTRFQLNYTGGGQPVASGANKNFAGIYIQRKVIMDEVYVNGFTNDGIYFAPYDASEGTTSTLGTIGNAVFFCELRNVWSKSNGRDGIRVRMGANANTFINCDFSKNGAAGFHHLTDGGSTYGNTVMAGRRPTTAHTATHFENGTNITTQWPLRRIQRLHRRHEHQRVRQHALRRATSATTASTRGSALGRCSEAHRRRKTPTSASPASTPTASRYGKAGGIFTGTKMKETGFWQDGDHYIERHSQDIEPIIETVKALQNANAFGSSEMRHAAKIPTSVIENYIKAKGIKF